MHEAIISAIVGSIVTVIFGLLGWFIKTYFFDSRKKKMRTQRLDNIYKPLFVACKKTSDFTELASQVGDIANNHRDICSNNFLELEEFINTALSYPTLSESSVRHIRSHVNTNYNWLCKKLKRNCDEREIGDIQEICEYESISRKLTCLRTFVEFFIFFTLITSLIVTFLFRSSGDTTPWYSLSFATGWSLCRPFYLKINKWLK